MIIMAIMIPSTISPEIKSNAEKRIFEWFRLAPNTERWVVLHSLGISNHNTAIYGEIDFLVLAPKFGFFALEVKGGRVTREQGSWAFTDRYGNTAHHNRGPFEQAKDGIHSVMKSIKRMSDREHSGVAETLFGYGVMFPDIMFESDNITEEQFRIFDHRHSNDVYRYIKSLSHGTKQKLHQVYGNNFNIKEPSVQDVKYVKDLLRGDFDFVVSLSAQLKYAEEHLITLTTEQYSIIDQLEDNSRNLIHGPAGTGKTLLALEATKKAVANNERVALFCYNRLLGEFFTSYFNNQPYSLRPDFVGTFHKYMMVVLKEKQIDLPQAVNLHEYYGNILPNALIDSLLEDNSRFDRIIIDEAQDLITPIYLDVLDLSLLNGISRGKWIFFGDFLFQTIYRDGGTQKYGKDLLEEKSNFTNFRLTVNCRNTKPIIHEINVIAEIPKGQYSDRGIEGIPVNYYICEDDESQKEKLILILTTLLQDKVARRDITILSPRAREHSIVKDIVEFKIVNYSLGINDISFSTIHAFKGLENRVIILIDINTFYETDLMYVALSRARLGLYVLQSKEARKEYLELQKRRLCSDE